jgi:phosphate transport system substrate-binding protein
MKEFMAEFTSETTWGNDGYLSEKGLIPMSDKERKRFTDSVNGLQALVM